MTKKILGVSFTNNTVHFSLFSSSAKAVTLGLFVKEKLQREIPLKQEENIWSCSFPYKEGFDYAVRIGDHWLADPYGKNFSTVILAKLEKPKPFDWQNDTAPSIAKQDLIIYEMHVRGFTADPSSRVKHPGTYLGMIEKIPHLKRLGVNAVELMPIFGFDQFHVKPTQKMNYWGYNPLHFFAPHRGYAVNDPVLEFKQLVRELHKNGIEVILDVVYNHTGEEGDPNYFVNFRGIDNGVYYMLDENGHYRNYTGCGNTVNCNHPIVQEMILDSLRYWIEEMHVDGFRFDLASILTRDTSGQPIENPPVIQAMSQDPIIRKAKLIAEAWDAAGLYQIGIYPKWDPYWMEWNGRYRDVVRRFIKGTEGHAGVFASALSGSSMIYPSPINSVNFITAHDGYSLRDLVTYQEKHNEANGENNQDGNNQNDSWNCGCEGPTNNPIIEHLREKQMRNFFMSLFLSQGIPMLLMGDEVGQTRKGNNNPYTLDNEINWFPWDVLEKNEKILDFVIFLIQLRLHHPELRYTRFPAHTELVWYTNWDAHSRVVAFSLSGTVPLFAAFNASSEQVQITLPKDHKWRQLIFTEEDWDQIKLNTPLSSEFVLAPYSALLAKG